MVGKLTRSLVMSVKDHQTREVVETRRFPAGTEVYVREHRNGTFRVRVPGTLFTQVIYPATVEPC